MSAHASACGPASACHIRFSYSRRAQRCSSSRTRAFSAANTLSLLAAADTASSAILDKLCVCVCVCARARVYICTHGRTCTQTHIHMAASATVDKLCILSTALAIMKNMRSPSLSRSLSAVTDTATDKDTAASCLQLPSRSHALSRRRPCSALHCTCTYMYICTDIWI